MKLKKQNLEISCDGKSICYSDKENNLIWRNTAPSLEKWKSLNRSSQPIESLEKGVYLWLNGISAEEVIVVFRPYKGLDFNLVYSALTGELVGIHEAR
ncbi:hypothetical protein [Cupriavidus sp. 2SB]|uniref:hypothetical protein n=1 Tax=Cupriavidus sp. 2SB TaxID=2502199 RepID=UPI0010F7E50F|nr:hypothetical protein [Cupriavidus sp. 2SB]